MQKLNMGLVAAVAMTAGALAAAPMEPGSEPEPGSARNRPGGNVVVPGGGAKERARRLARMHCAECGEHIGRCECHVTPA